MIKINKKTAYFLVICAILVAGVAGAAFWVSTKKSHEETRRLIWWQNALLAMEYQLTCSKEKQITLEYFDNLGYAEHRYLQMFEKEHPEMDWMKEMWDRYDEGEKRGKELFSNGGCKTSKEAELAAAFYDRFKNLPRVIMKDDMDADGVEPIYNP